MTNRKYNLNENYFEIIDTEEKAYWLGFLYADGCIANNRTLQIELSSIDESHIYKFLKAISSEHPITNPTGRSSSLVRVGSSKMVSDLMRHGCLPRKSLTLEYPKNLDSSLDKHFIRGYFDGDGCISYSTYKEKRKNRNPNNILSVWTVKFVGTQNFLSAIVDKLSLPVNKIISDGTRGYQLKYGGKTKPFTVLSTFYEDSNIYLDRKYEKYKDFEKDIKI